MVTARAKGLSEFRAILKYPVRVALNPFISTVGYTLALLSLGQHHRLHRAELADRWSFAPESPAGAGYVPRRYHCATAGGDDRDRHAHLRHSLDLGRSAHTPGGVVVAEEAVLHGVETPAVPRTTEAGERIYVASQWQLMWWRFRKHHLAMAAGIVVVCFYLVAIFADFLATTDPELSDAKRSLMPPQRIYWFDGWSLQPACLCRQGRA